jgi:hypothetical protein
VTPDQIKLCVQLAIAAVLLAGAAWAGWAINGWRLGAELERTKGERDLVTSAATACSAGVDLAKKTSEAAVKGTAVLVAAAERLNKPAEKIVERTETIIERPMTGEQAADCNWGWGQIEAAPRQKAGAAP